MLAIKELDTATGDATVLNHRLDYLHRDNLGSVRLITDANGQLIERLDYDAFGERRQYLDATLADSSPGFGSTALATLGIARPGSDCTPALAHYHRGFTGHDMLDGLNLIHMNGRLYDPEIGRFPSQRNPDGAERSPATMKCRFFAELD